MKSKKCAECSGAPVASGCVKIKQKLSFEYEDLEDLLQQLDDRITIMENLSKKEIDRKKWLSKEEHTQDYIQQVVNKIDVLLTEVSELNPDNTKVSVTSDLLSGELTISQLFNIILKELATIKKRVNKKDSDLYLS